MASNAFWGCIESGLIQHCIRAHGEIFRTSGGSTPMLRHRINATLIVFMRSFMRHLLTTSASSSPAAPASP